MHSVVLKYNNYTTTITHYQGLEAQQLQPSLGLVPFAHYSSSFVFVHILHSLFFVVSFAYYLSLFHYFCPFPIIHCPWAYFLGATHFILYHSPIAFRSSSFVSIYLSNSLRFIFRPSFFALCPLPSLCCVLSYLFLSIVLGLILLVPHILSFTIRPSPFVLVLSSLIFYHFLRLSSTSIHHSSLILGPWSFILRPSFAIALLFFAHLHLLSLWLFHQPNLLCFC